MHSSFTELYQRLIPASLALTLSGSSGRRRGTRRRLMLRSLFLLSVLTTCTTLFLLLQMKCNVNKMSFSSNVKYHFIYQQQPFLALDPSPNSNRDEDGNLIRFTNTTENTHILNSYSNLDATIRKLRNTGALRKSDALMSQQLLKRQEETAKYCTCRSENMNPHDCRESPMNDNDTFPGPRARKHLKQAWEQSLTRLTRSHKRNWIFFQTKGTEQGCNRPQVSIEWCPIFKAASTPWMALFGKLSGVLTPHTEARVREGKLNIVKLLKDFRLNRPRADDGRGKQYKMVVVRHPFERILSAYRDKLERVKGRDFYHRKYGYMIVSRFRHGNQFNYTSLGLLSHTERFHSVLARVLEIKKKMSLVENETSTSNPSTYRQPTFPEFVQYLMTVRPELMDEHWRPMYLDCNPCQTPFDLILKVETLEGDKDAVLGLLAHNNCSRSQDADLNETWRRWANKAHRRTGAGSFKSKLKSSSSQQYFSQISNLNLQVLYNIYEPDFLLFNYSADKYFAMTDGGF